MHGGVCIPLRGFKFLSAISYGETFYELQFFAESICRTPLAKAVAFGSPTATYLGLSKTGYVVDDAVKERMHEMLNRVQSGEVVRDWNLEQLAAQCSLARARTWWITRSAMQKRCFSTGKRRREEFKPILVKKIPAGSRP